MHLSRLNPIALAISGFLLSFNLLADVFFPQTTADLIAAINTANTNEQNDIIYLGGLTFTLTAVDNTSTNGPNGLPIIGPDTNAGINHTLEIQQGTITRSTANGTPAFRLLEVFWAASLSLDNVTLSNGSVSSAQFGGAILVDSNGGWDSFNNGTLASVNNCTFSGNVAGGGGGIAIMGIAGVIRNSTFTGNSSTGTDPVLSGGAGLLLINNEDFPENNVAISQLPQLDGCSLDLLTSSTFSRNISASFGGGVAVMGPDCTIDVLSDSTFNANSAATQGGGISINNDPEFDTGGAIVTLANTTIAANTATVQGGGIAISSTSNLGNLTSTIVATNTAPTGPDISTVGAIALESFNLIGNNSGSSIVAGNPNPNDSLVGTSLSLINPLLGSLQNNGGPTQTMAITDASPAFNAGANPLQLLFDQRGPFYYRVAEGQADIGAYECQHCEKEEQHFFDDDDDEGFIEDDGFDDFGGDIGPFGPPPPMAIDPSYGNWGGYQGQGLPNQGFPADAPIASATAQASSNESMKKTEAPNQANKMHSRAEASENNHNSESLNANTKEAEEYETVPRKKSSGCSLIDGPGQAANNIGLLFAIILYGLRMLKRRKSLNC